MPASEPKDLKQSIRNKYKRRIFSLKHALEQYEFIAIERLENGGNIRDRDEVEEILKNVQALNSLIPDTFELDKKSSDAISKILGF